MAKSGETQRVRIINRIGDIRRTLGRQELILGNPEEELLERLVIAIQEFLRLFAD